MVHLSFPFLACRVFLEVNLGSTKLENVKKRYSVGTIRNSSLTRRMWLRILCCNWSSVTAAPPPPSSTRKSFSYESRTKLGSIVPSRELKIRNFTNLYNCAPLPTIRWFFCFPFWPPPVELQQNTLNELYIFSAKKSCFSSSVGLTRWNPLGGKFPFVTLVKGRDGHCRAKMPSKSF